MKKIYQAPEMMAAEMIALSMVATTPGVTVNRNAEAIDAGSVGVKNEIWDDWNE
ncbi:MAG: hypothetical protein J5661_04800 [Bacteroidaceae bacterium]|nr:hypothetical protein [Bacteroidaceae bacterium]